MHLEVLNVVQNSLHFERLRPTGDLFRAFLAEFFAMTMFVFLGCGSVAATGEFLVDDEDFGVKVSVARVLPIATAFGLAITVLAFNVGPISGGHINPAVTFSLMLMKKISVTRAFVYMAAQFLGAIFGACLLWGSISNSSYVPSHTSQDPNFRPGIDIVRAVGRPPFYLGANYLNPTISPLNGLLLEIMGTAILIGTVLTTAVDNRSMGTTIALAPLPIGISIWVVHLVLIPWTGCGINPARTFGPAFVNSLAANDTWEQHWFIYYVGPAIGSTATCMIMCLFWGGRNPPGTVMHHKKIEPMDAEQSAGSPISQKPDLEVDLDAITI